MFKINRKRFQYSLLLAVITLLSVNACTSNSVKSEHDIKIERVDSSKANIRHAYLFESDGQMTLRGTLERRLSGRGPVPGHLHITLLNPQGKVLKEADISYMRKHRKSSISRFSTKLPMKLIPGSTIKITHFGTESHEGIPLKDKWRNSK